MFLLLSHSENTPQHNTLQLGMLPRCDEKDLICRFFSRPSRQVDRKIDKIHFFGIFPDIVENVGVLNARREKFLSTGDPSQISHSIIV